MLDETIAIVLNTQRRRDDTFPKASVHVRLQKPESAFIFSPLHHVLRQRDCTSLDLPPLPPPSEMGPECIRALRLSHCHAKTVAVITAEAIVSR